MHPILFKIPIFGGLTIHTYGALVAVGFLAGIFYVTREGRRVGEDPAVILDLTFWLIIAAIIGSRVYYVLTAEPGTLLDDPLTLVKIWRGGLVFQGGVIAAVLVGIWWVIRHKLPVWIYMDIYAPAIALGHFFGRIGCTMSGCCYGRPALPGSWYAITFPPDIGSYAPPLIGLYPTQLMEAAGELIIFLGLFLFRKKKRFDGQLMAIYMIVYPLLRITVEFFRDVGTRNFVFDGISVAQVAGVVMIVFAVWIWIYRGRRQEGE